MADGGKGKAEYGHDAVIHLQPVTQRRGNSFNLPQKMYDQKIHGAAVVDDEAYVQDGGNSSDEKDGTMGFSEPARPFPRTTTKKNTN